MFETTTLSYGQPANRVWATAMGFTGQAVLVACALVVPLISPQTIGRAILVTTLAPPGAPPPPPAPMDPRVVPRSDHAANTQVHEGLVRLPVRIPPVAAILIDDPEPVGAGQGPRDGVQGGIGIPSATSAINHLIGDITHMVPLPVHPPEAVTRPAPVAAPPTAKPPRITQLRMATPIRKVDPVYPPMARAARVSGTVELLGVLGTDGRIHELRVLRGHPLLVKAALEAVSQWLFEPTVLNGQAVEVAAPIMVNFILNQ